MSCIKWNILRTCIDLYFNRWCDKCLFTTNAPDWFIEPLEWTTALLYGSLQGLCNVAGVLKSHALTKHDAGCKLPGKWTIDIAMMCAHTAKHDVASSIVMIVVPHLEKWLFKCGKKSITIPDIFKQLRIIFTFDHIFLLLNYSVDIITDDFHKSHLSPNSHH